MSREQATVAVRKNSIIEYRGMKFDTAVLDAVLNTDARLLWVFLKDKDGTVQPVPYSEEKVIWLEETDLHQPREVEI